MDLRTYEGLEDRLKYLESALTPSFDATPVLKQLEKLQSKINSSQGQEFKTLFTLLKSNGLWHLLAANKSEVPESVQDDMSISSCKNVIIASYERFINFIDSFENLIALAEDMKRQVELSSPYYEAVLTTTLPIDEFNQLVSNFSILLARSISLMERSFQFMIEENQFWSDIESKLISLERDVKLISKEKMDQLKYTG